jgi:tetratricopeptide (TPR) repeat protein
MLRTYFTTFLGLVWLILLAACSDKHTAACDQAYTEVAQQYHTLRDQPADSKDFFNQLEQVENRLFRAFEACPNDARFPALMAEVQITANQSSLALLYAQKALTTEPDIWQSQHAMASALTLVQQYEQAVPHALLANKLAPQRPGLQLGLCRAYAMADKHQQAIASCSTVIESPHTGLHATAYYLRSRAYQGSGDKEKAHRDLQQAQALGYKIN